MIKRQLADVCLSLGNAFYLAFLAAQLYPSHFYTPTPNPQEKKTGKELLIQNKGFLAKVRNIAELRSPARDDGPVARILWKTAMILRNQPAGVSLQDMKESEQLLGRAYNAKSQLLMSGEAGEGEIYDRDARDRMTEMEKEEDGFDLLVPGYFS
jgi:hypothetical protein